MNSNPTPTPGSGQPIPFDFLSYPVAPKENAVDGGQTINGTEIEKQFDGADFTLTAPVVQDNFAVSSQIFSAPSPTAWEHAAAVFGWDTLLPSVPDRNIPSSGKLLAEENARRQKFITEGKGDPGPDDLAKIPSAINANGTRHRISEWQTLPQTDEEIAQRKSDLARWSQDSRLNILVHLARHVTIDIDVEDAVIAAAIESRITEILGCEPPVRKREGVGKRSLFVRVQGNRHMHKGVVRKEDHTNHETGELVKGWGVVEFLGGAQQSVAVGVHGNGSRYYWERLDLTKGVDAFQMVTEEQVTAVWEMLCALPNTSNSGFGFGEVTKAVKAAVVDHEDPIVKFFSDNGMLGDFNKSSGHFIALCPNRAAHSSHTDWSSSTVLAPAAHDASGSYMGTRLICKHAGCEAILKAKGSIEMFRMAGVPRGILSKQYPVADLSVFDGAVETAEERAAREQKEASRVVVGVAATSVVPFIAGGSTFTSNTNLSTLQRRAMADLVEATSKVDYTTPLPIVSATRKDKLPKSVIENFAEIISRIGASIRYNAMSREREIYIPGRVVASDNAEGDSITHLKSECAKFNMPILQVNEFVSTFAYMNQYHPVIDWIESKPWDGVSRLQKLYDTIKAEDESLKELILKRWMISAIAVLYAGPEGVQTSGVAVLQGPQNLGKTRWLESLAPKELGLTQSGIELNPSDKDSVMRANTKWITELGELDSTFRAADVSKLKAYISNSVDRLRPPYGTGIVKYTRRTVYAASVNPEDFLQDPTGNRRYWVIKCININHAHDIDMQQVWVEVKETLFGKEPHFMSNEELDRINANNKKFTVALPIAERIATQFDWSADISNRVFKTATEVCIAIGIQNPQKSDTSTAGKVLQGYVDKSLSTKRVKDGYSYYAIPVANNSNRPVLDVFSGTPKTQR